MRSVFMGTPEFAVPSLRRLAAVTELVGVFTQPDRRQGRGLTRMPPPVKTVASELGIPVYQPQRLAVAANLELLEELAPDLIVVVAYAQILPAAILNLPRYGCINVHASLLPAYRGGAPIHWAIVNGETETGITTMLMDSGLDTGDMLLQQTLTIGPDDNCGQVHDRLALLGADTLAATISGLSKGEIKPQAQPASGASYARNLTKQDGQIKWEASALAIHNRVRGLNPWPVAYTSHQGQTLRVFQSKLETCQARAAEPGSVVGIVDAGLLVQTGCGVLLLKEVQPANKRRMSAADYARGYAITVGSRFGD